MDENGNTPISDDAPTTITVDDYGTLTVGTARDLISDSPITRGEIDGEAFREYLNSGEVVYEVPYGEAQRMWDEEWDLSFGLLHEDEHKIRYLVEGHVKIEVGGGFAGFIQGKVISDNEISLDATEMICTADYGVYDTVEEAIAVAKNVVCHSKKDDGCAVPYEAVIYSIDRGVQTEMMTVIPDTQNEEQLVWEDLFEEGIT